ncbi:uncharacterized protein LOC111053758 [Nilaparvata lugens]|uniref:uncharacterized protein LOC111053758 n=1 Tax=Nilaparvata lugens TaxID=108931 RepID=UPI00193E8F64|nr:uncharacterized protein LOC111053758 [Nilaparvata lugens]
MTSFPIPLSRTGALNTMVLVFVGLIALVSGHGRLIEPPSRASMWRYGFDTPPNYNDHELFCGGFSRMWSKNGGKCGVCGDPWDLPQPRPHEAGGKYGSGMITRKYKVSSQFIIRIELTANHRGYFEFRLCPNNNPKLMVSQQCLDKYVLRRVESNKSTSSEERQTHVSRFYPGSENKIHEMRYMLPEGLTCSQCVLQWRYVAGNNWGRCPNGTEMVGCGPQEEFRACADVSIEDGTGSSDDTPFEENVIPEDDYVPGVSDMNKVYQQSNQDWWLFSITIAVSSLALALTVYALLYLYYYHAGNNVKEWLSGDRYKFWNKSSPATSPIPPPRAKRITATIGFQGVPENLV